MNRRQMLAGTAAVGAAWITPEILTAKPVAGATLSFPEGHATPAPAKPPLAETGDDTEREAGIGAALIAFGWAVSHWSPRIAKAIEEVWPK